MKQTKNNLDECQEQKLLQIEHGGCWLAFWGLAIAILIQCVVCGPVIRNIVGEVVVLMCVAAYLVIGCLKEGIWDRKLRPNLKTNLLISAAAGLVVGAVWFVITYRDYHKPLGSLAVAALTFALTFGVCLLLLTCAGRIYKDRVRQLEDPKDER